jgi:peptidoglycan/LPS O-acetylase OafA/YrhL
VSGNQQPDHLGEIGDFVKCQTIGGWPKRPAEIGDPRFNRFQEGMVVGAPNAGEVFSKRNSTDRLSPTLQHFDSRIESLRGIAASSVLIAHASAVFRVDGHPSYWAVPFMDQSLPAKIMTLFTSVFNPDAAVVLFFVLSGFVLTLSFSRATLSLKQTTAPYLFRRALRLLPVMWVSILLYLAIMQFAPFYPPDWPDLFSDWFLVMFGPPHPLMTDALRNLMLINFRANPVTWTMYVEVIGSITIPFLYLWHQKTALPLELLSVMLLVTVAWIFPDSLTVRYLFCFDLGAIIVYRSSRYISNYSGIIFTVGIALFLVERLALTGRIGVFVDAAGSFLVLSAIVRSGGFAVLTAAPLRFIGRISYSLYLFHPIGLYVVGLILARIWYVGMVTNILTVMLGMAVSVALAALAYRYVEEPCIRFGRSRWLRPVYQPKPN